MTIYCTDRKYCFSNLENAIEKAKEILLERALTLPENTNITFSVTKGKKGGYAVKINIEWWRMGNEKLLQCVIAPIEILDM